jgi:hypothetical protein
VKGDTGATGPQGTSVSVTGVVINYQIGNSGTTAPAGQWAAAVPSPQQGKYLWTRTQITILNGSASSVQTSYSVSYYGTDGDDAPSMSFAIDSDEDSPTHGHLLLTLSS